ncbi:hypothetical protein L0F63_000144 [Massospora cicadina]|nr:hypothetical protein L0F63_000144 [Massospora cicadina]
MVSLILYFVASALGAPTKAEGRILGGQIVALVPEWLGEAFLDGVHRCGVNFLTETHAITVAHCSDSPSGMIVRRGSVDSEVTSIVTHPDYGGTETYANDIAVWTVAKSSHPPRA